SVPRATEVARTLGFSTHRSMCQSIRTLRKAVIPAAGFGTRMLPAAKAVPKELLPVLDRPTIQYVIEEALAGGLEDVLLVTSRDKRASEHHFDRNSALGHRLNTGQRDGLRAAAN